MSAALMLPGDAMQFQIGLRVADELINASLVFEFKPAQLREPGVEQLQIHSPTIGKVHP